MSDFDSQVRNRNLTAFKEHSKLQNLLATNTEQSTKLETNLSKGKYNSPNYLVSSPEFLTSQSKHQSSLQKQEIEVFDR